VTTVSAASGTPNSTDADADGFCEPPPVPAVLTSRALRKSVCGAADSADREGRRVVPALLGAVAATRMLVGMQPAGSVKRFFAAGVVAGDRADERHDVAAAAVEGRRPVR
jgi:hypothetical protein